MTCVMKHIFNMAMHRRQGAFSAREVTELVLQEGSDEEPDVDARGDVENYDDDDNYADEWSNALSDDEMAVAQEMELGDTDTDSNSTKNDEWAASPAREKEEIIVEHTPLTSDSYGEEDAKHMHTWCKNLTHFPQVS